MLLVQFQRGCHIGCRIRLTPGWWSVVPPQLRPISRWMLRSRDEYFEVEVNASLSWGTLDSFDYFVVVMVLTEIARDFHRTNAAWHCVNWTCWRAWLLRAQEGVPSPQKILPSPRRFSENALYDVPGYPLNSAAILAVPFKSAPTPPVLTTTQRPEAYPRSRLRQVHIMGRTVTQRFIPAHSAVPPPAWISYTRDDAISPLSALYICHSDDGHFGDGSGRDTRSHRHRNGSEDLGLWQGMSVSSLSNRPRNNSNSTPALTWAMKPKRRWL